MNIGQAIEAMRAGKAITRPTWNGKGMWLRLQVPDANSKMTQPYIYIEYPPNPDHPVFPDGCRVPWLASQADILAQDWIEVCLSLEPNPPIDPAAIRLANSHAWEGTLEELRAAVLKRPAPKIVELADHRPGWVNWWTACLACGADKVLSCHLEAVEGPLECPRCHEMKLVRTSPAE